MGLFTKNKEQEVESEVAEEENTYEGQYICGNCEVDYEDDEGYDCFDIPKGTTIKDYFKNKICSNCGCKLIQESQ